ncbi:SpoIIE family protein phosphatase [Algivirga pacifica]|uniref:PPM-type phosphatase domain-containing protein n=1 Tax=Algivirga pacifica TaxID=1162670 RepID=A0ABP9DKT1_9BACT
MAIIRGIFFVLLFFQSVAYSRENKDLLKQLQEHPQEDSIRVSILSNLGFSYWTSDPEKGLAYGKEAVALAQKLGYRRGEAWAYGALGACYYGMANLPAMHEADMKCLMIAEELQDKRLLSSALTNLGNYHLSNKDTVQALEHYKRSAAIDAENPAPVLMTNIGIIYYETGHVDSAFYYLDKSIAGAIAYRDTTNLTLALLNKGNYMAQEKRFREADRIMEEANSHIKTEANALFESLYFSTKGMIYEGFGQYDKAEKALLKALAIVKERGFNEQLRTFYKQAASFYENRQQFEKAYYSLMEYSLLNEEIYKKELLQRREEMDAKYEKVKSQKKLEMQAQQLDTQRLIQNIFIGAFLVFIVMMIALYWSNIQKKKLNAILIAQGEDLKEQAHELLELNEEVGAQKAYLEKSHQLLSDKNRQVTDSIKAAQLMQQRLLPSLDVLQYYFADAFTLFIPKDMVSGDLYWSKKMENVIAIAVVDCTGHGVPGAFMSMQAYSLLEEVSNNIGLQDPALLLDEIQQRMMSGITTAENQVERGMDMSLCIIEELMPGKFVVHFAGAKQSLYYTHQGQLLKLKGDNMSLGKRARVKRFKKYTSHELFLTTGEVLYLLSDGFVDASNEERKKLGSQKLEDILLAYHKEAMNVQLEHLDKSFQQHTTGAELRDDVTLLGIRL